MSNPGQGAAGHPTVVGPAEPRWPGLTTGQSLAVASEFGGTLAVGVLAGLWGGQWLDGQFDTGVVFTLLGVCTGLAACTVGVVVRYRATLRTSAQAWQAHPSHVAGEVLGGEPASGSDSHGGRSGAVGRRTRKRSGRVGRA